MDYTQSYLEIAKWVYRATCPLVEVTGDDAAIFGSGTLLRTGEDYYLSTAWHVAEAIESHRLEIPGGPGGRTLRYVGSSKYLGSKELDVAVVRFNEQEMIRHLQGLLRLVNRHSQGLDADGGVTTRRWHGNQRCWRAASL